mgnify:CR=1 FL=1
MILYYIFKKSSKTLNSDDRRKWLNYRLRPLVVISVLFNIGVTIALEVEIIKIIKNPTLINVRKLSCTSPIWISTAVFEFATVIVFFLFVLKLDK